MGWSLRLLMQKGFLTRNQWERPGTADGPAEILRKNSRNSPVPCREGLAWGCGVVMEPLPLGSVLHFGDFGLFFRSFVFIHIGKRSVFLYFCIVLHFIITGEILQTVLLLVLSCLSEWCGLLSSMEKRPFLLLPCLDPTWECAGASPQPLTTHFAHP